MSEILAEESDGPQGVEVDLLLSDADIPKHRACNYQSVRNSVLAVILVAVALKSIVYSDKDAPNEISKVGVQAVVGLSHWNPYIDSIMGHSDGNCDKVAIIGLADGNKWTSDAHSSSLKITVEEAKKLSDDLKMPHDSADFIAHNLKIAGMKYFYLTHIDYKMFLFKLKDHGSITVQKTKTAIIIAHTAEDKQQGMTNLGVKQIAESLLQHNMRRLKRDSYTRRLEDASTPVVAELGSGYTNVGFGGDDKPRYAQPSVVGWPKDGAKHAYIGDEAIEKQDILNLHYPIHEGVFENLDEIEILLANALSKLEIDPSKEGSITLSEAPLTPSEKREKLTQIVFESHEFTQFFIANNAVLAAAAEKKTTALVVHIGEGTMYAVPVYEGHALNYATVRSGLSGSDLTDYLSKMLTERGYSFSKADKVTVDAIKRKLGYVAVDFEHNMEISGKSSALENAYELPSGEPITIGYEQFKVGEALFQPSFIGMEGLGIHETAYKSVMMVPSEMRDELVRNTILAGSETFYPGLEIRLQNEISAICPPSTKIKVAKTPNSERSTWDGGNIVSQLTAFPSMAVTRQEYEDIGPSVVNYKCF